MGNGENLTISCTGHLTLPSFIHNKVVHLKNVLCMPHITRNLVSISKITKDNNVLVEYSSNKFVIKDKLNHIVLLQRTLKDGLYMLVPPKLFVSYLQASKENEFGSIVPYLSSNTMLPQCYDATVFTLVNVNNKPVVNDVTTFTLVHVTNEPVVNGSGFTFCMIIIIELLKLQCMIVIVFLLSCMIFIVV